MARNLKLRDRPLDPNLQVSFFHKLKAIKRLYLHEALRVALKSLQLEVVDSELKAYVSPSALKTVAQFGLRGETIFPVPSLLRSNPFLLGYYRLLYGLSQKEFYSKGPFGRFKRMEKDGHLSAGAEQSIDDLCHSLVSTSVQLMQGIGGISLQTIHELQLLTVGPQLRGSENTRIGQRATKQVYDLIRKLVADHVLDETATTLVLENASGRKVLIEFASDPDIRITETLPEDVRPIVSVEVKGGSDYSNIHNRLGEAEKSHQKARAKGFFEFWTIVRPQLDAEAAKRESPTTSRFFNLDRIRNSRTKEHRAFRDTLSSMLGIKIATRA